MSGSGSVVVGSRRAVGIATELESLLTTQIVAQIVEHAESIDLLRSERAVRIVEVLETRDVP